MNCKKVRDLIFTDYLDETISLKFKKDVDNHLFVCRECRSLLEKVKLSQDLVLKSLPQQDVPLEVWDNLQNKIIQKQIERKKRVFLGLSERVFIPALVTVIIIFVLLVKFDPVNNQVNSDNYFGAVLGYYDEKVNGDFTDYGTDLEKYFL